MVEGNTCSGEIPAEFQRTEQDLQVEVKTEATPMAWSFVMTWKGFLFQPFGPKDSEYASDLLMTLKRITSPLFEGKRELRTENCYPWKLFYVRETT